MDRAAPQEGHMGGETPSWVPGTEVLRGLGPISRGQGSRGATPGMEQACPPRQEGGREIQVQRGEGAGKGQRAHAGPTEARNGC